MVPKHITGTVRSVLSASNRSSSLSSFSTSAVNENEFCNRSGSELLHHIFALNENKSALVEMEGIPSKARTLQMNLMLGKLYRNSRHTPAAISCFKKCLRDMSGEEEENAAELTIVCISFSEDVKFLCANR